MASINTAILKLKEISNDALSPIKMDKALAHRALFIALTNLFTLISVSFDPSVVNNEFLTILEDIWMAKTIALSNSILSLLQAVYEVIISKASGHGIRVILTSALNIGNNKSISAPSRECSLNIMSMVLLKRLNDCASLSTDVVMTISKLVKAPETSIRIACISCLETIVKTENGKLIDLYPEITKLAGKCASDKQSEVRCCVMKLLETIVRFSDYFTITPVDALHPIILKGLEDEAPAVQSAACSALASIYEMQIRGFVEGQEQAKIGAARGSDTTPVTAPKSPLPATTSRLSLKFTSSKRQLYEEKNDLKTMAAHLVKLVQKNLGSLRVGYLFSLGKLIENYLDIITADELESVVLLIMALLQDSSIQQLPYEDQTLLRVRLSYIFRSNILSKISETQILTIGSLLIRLTGGLESSSRSDLEMHLALDEVHHMLNVLGATAVALVDEATTCATINLRHSCFGVRVAAANILVTLASCTAFIGLDILNSALANTSMQAKQLMVLEAGDGELSIENEDSSYSSSSLKRKSSREMERLQRLHFFHGHALVISSIVKNSSRIPTGLPHENYLKVFDLGLNMLSSEFKAVNPASRPILCSIIRAGGLVVSACLSLGYDHSRERIQQVLDVCVKVLNISENTGNNPVQTSSSSSKTEELLLYEMMCIESAVVAMNALLLYSSDALLYEANCLPLVIENLENCFRSLKNKYQPNYRTHFRFRTLHITLLECFLLLPPGSYPNCSQHIYIEALRIIRDSISTGLECNLPSKNIFISTSSSNKTSFAFPMIAKDSVYNEQFVALKMESHLSVLQKKENEAFLSLFGKNSTPLMILSDNFLDDNSILFVNGNHSNEKSPINILLNKLIMSSNSHQSTLVDVRSLDSAIHLLGVTFSHQLSEYQEKAVQLFTMALQQVSPQLTSSTRISSLTGKNMFFSDEERKRKERLHFITLKAIVSALFLIVEHFPVHSGLFVESEFSWRQSIVDLLYECLGNKEFLVRYVAGMTLAKFAMKWKGSDKSPFIVSTLSNRIRSSIVLGLEKKINNDISIMNEFTGYVIALSYMWVHARELPEIRSLVLTVSVSSLFIKFYVDDRGL